MVKLNGSPLLLPAVSGRLERLVGRGLVPNGGFALPSFLVRSLRLLYEALGARVVLLEFCEVSHGFSSIVLRTYLFLNRQKPANWCF